jgi:predicted ATPase/DNA-binding CsgD family transcriptional regulator
MQITAGDVISARPPSTTFVGRRDELGRLRALISGSPLLTLTGPGGSGKTRLLEELVAQLSRSYRGGMAVAYLAGASEPAEVSDVVAASIGLRGAGEPAATLVDYLRERRFLLALDNCEHVRDATAELALRILQDCPGVTILTTSRQPLLVPGEQLFPVGGLLEDAAVTLFTDRVRLALPSFVLPEGQRSLVARLCARLDGLPLAIELAAARLRYVGLAEFQDRMTGHLADLGSTSSAAPERQRTLRGAIDWSHDLLDERQRVLWRRLCIFVGGFTLTAAEAVATFPPLAGGDVERLLGDLVDQSMVAFDLAHDRYRVIEAMREYGLERLGEAGEEAATAQRHSAWMLDLADDLDRRWWGPTQATALDEMSAEAANLRAALESCRAVGAGEVGLRIATSSVWYWMTRASHAEAARWFVPFLDHTADPVLGARAHVAAAWIAVLSARLEQTRVFLDRAGEFAATAGNPRIDAYIRIVTALLLISEQRADEAVGLARATLEDPASDAMCRSWAMIELGIVAFLTGNTADAARVSQQALEVCRAVGESWTQVVHLHLLAAATWQGGDPGRATDFLLDALRIDRRLDDIWHRAWTIEALGWITVDVGRHERAARLLGVASGCWAYTGSGLTEPWQVFHDTALGELTRRMGDTRLAAEMEAGRQLDQVRAMSFALEDVVVPPALAGSPLRVSPRELEVAGLIAEGCANREIGERLFLSPRTVETHVQHLMNKLGVGSRSEIAAWHAREVAGKPPA